MPGKVNPTQAEALTMVCAQVLGNDVAIDVGGASGNFELNVYKPLIVRTSAIGAPPRRRVRRFEEHCARGIEPDHDGSRAPRPLADARDGARADDRLRQGGRRSRRRRTRTHTTLKEAALALGYLTDAEFDEHVRPEKMVGPGRLSGKDLDRPRKLTSTTASAPRSYDRGSTKRVDIMN
jgi:fumarate hydratase class II